VEHREARQRHEGAENDVQRMLAQHLEDGPRLQFLRLHRRAELLAGDDAQAREERHDVDREGDEEGIAPAPGEEIGLRQAADEIAEEDACKREADRRAELRDHRVPAPVGGRRAQVQ
jgi:hypothetical protein